MPLKSFTLHLTRLTCAALLSLPAAGVSYAQQSPFQTANTPINAPSQQSAQGQPLSGQPPAAAPLPPGFSPFGQQQALPVIGAAPGFSLSPEEAAELEKRLEEEAAEQKRKQREGTFDAAIGQVLPLKPEEIRQMLEFFKQSRQAAETPLIVPDPKVQIQNISLDPGEIPSVIKMAPGHVTTLNILDMSGQPWPVRDLSWAGQFDVTPPDEGGHVIRITPLSAHGVGNISIQLVDLITPITLSLHTNLEETHYRFDARIPKLGPLASVPIIAQGGLSATAGDENLLSFLEGIIPSEAVRLDVDSPDERTRVWELGNEYFLRTPFSLLSPAWNSSVKSADGMNIYTLNKVPVVLLSNNGRVIQTRIASQEE